MTEQRKFFRFPVSFKTVLFTFKDGSAAEVSTENFSRGGVGLEFSGQDLQQGSIVQMSLQVESGRTPIMFSGRVAWVSHAQDSQRVGIEITQIDPAQKSEILEKAYKSWVGSENEKQYKSS